MYVSTVLATLMLREVVKLLFIMVINQAGGHHCCCDIIRSEVGPETLVSKTFKRISTSLPSLDGSMTGHVVLHWQKQKKNNNNIKIIQYLLNSYINTGCQSTQNFALFSRRGLSYAKLLRTGCPRNS